MASPNDLRQMNRRQVVLSLLRVGNASRSDIARETGLSAPTAGKIVDELLAGHVVMQSAAGSSGERAGPGRPGQVLKLDDLSQQFLAIQLGPLNTRLTTLAVAPPAAADQWAKVIRTPPSLKRWTEGVVRASGPLLTHKPKAILVSLPGVLDASTGRTLLSPNARWMEGQSIADSLQKALKLPTYPIQEIQCLALGHRLTDPSAGDFLLVDFGIGVGSAAMIRGELLRGQLPFTGELGHTPVPGNRAQCGCGGIGCLETLIGRRQLLGDFADDADSLSDPEFSRVNAESRSGRLRQAMQSAGLGIAAAMNVLGLNHAVITGFAAELPPAILDVMKEAISTATLAGRFGPTRIDTARRHRLAGLASVGIDRVIAPAD